MSNSSASSSTIPMKTACHLCGKSYVNVKSHISKSHSYVCLMFDKDENIIFMKGGELTELFWQGERWDCNEIYGNADGTHRLIFGREEFDGEVHILFRRNATHATCREVQSLTTIEYSPTIPEGKRRIHGTCNIQVLHKFISVKPEEE